MHVRELLLDSIDHVSPPRAIENVSEEQAMRRLSGASHSIAEILAHMLFWQEWTQRRIEGVAMPIPTKAALGWPEVQSKSWSELQSRLISGLEALVKIAESGDLDQKIIPAVEVPHLANMTRRDGISHVAIHNSHHLGQIITLRQIMGLWPPPSGSMTW